MTNIIPGHRFSRGGRSVPGHADRSRAGAGPRRRNAVLALESLEDRTLLAVDYPTAATNLGSKLSGLQASIDQAFDAALAIPLVGSQLQKLDPIKNLVDQFSGKLVDNLNRDNSPEAVRSGFQSVLGPWLGNNQVTVAGSNESGLTVTLPLHVDATKTPDTADFSLGLGSFLSLSVTSQIQLNVGFDYLLQFTVSASDSSVSVNPTHLNQFDGNLPDTPLAVEFDVTLPNFKATGRLNNLMAVTAMNADDNNPTHFAGAIGVDVNPGDSPGVKLQAPADANVNLHLDLDFGAGAIIDPKISADLHLLWHFNNSNANPNQQNAFGSIKDLSLTNLQLNAGQLFPGFITQIIADVQKFTKPLQPIVDIVRTEVPGFSDFGVHMSLQSLMTLSGSDLGNAIDAIDFINNRLPVSPSGNGIVQLGSVSFTGSALADLLSGHPTIPDSSPAPSVQDLLSQANAASGGFLDKLGTSITPDGKSTNPSGFQFPIITDPVHCAWQLLSGQKATLFKYTMPSLTEEAAGKLGAGVGLFSVYVGGSIKVQVDLSVGYDTKGLKEFIDDKDHKAADFLDGFFIDNSKDASGHYATGVDFHGELTAGASLLGVTVGGGLFANANVHLADTNSENDPEHKVYLGQIIDKIESDPLSIFEAHGDIYAALNLSYGFDTPLANVTLFSVNIAKAELYNFDTMGRVQPPSFTPAPTTIPIHLADGDQTINVYERVAASHDSINQETDYSIVVDYGSSKEVFPLGSVVYNGANYVIVGDVHHYNLITTDPQTAGVEHTGNHKIVIFPGVNGGIQGTGNKDGDGNEFASLATQGASETAVGEPLNAVLVGGSGNDQLEYDGSWQSYLIGGGGSNTLVGGDVEFGNYPTTYSDFAVDVFGDAQYYLPAFPVDQAIQDSLTALRFRPGGGFNNLIGTTGNEILVGGPGGNLIDGQGGDDREIGGAGNDTFTVGVSRDNSIVRPHVDIYGLGGVDTLVMRAGDDPSSFLTPDPGYVAIRQGGSHLFDGEGRFAGAPPVQVTDATTGAIVVASDVAKVVVNGDGSYRVDDLSNTPVTYLQIGLRQRTLPDTQVDQVSVSGGPDQDTFDVNSAFEQAPAESFGHEAATVKQFQPGQASIVTLITNLQSSDQVTLDGAGGADTYVVTPDAMSAFNTTIQNTGPDPHETVDVFGDHLPAGSLDVNDSGVEFYCNGPQSTTQVRTEFVGDVDELSVYAPANGDEFITAERNIGATAISGGEGNVDFAISGGSRYWLAGEGVSDFYRLNLGLSRGITILGNASGSSEILLVDDHTVESGRGTEYSLSSGNLTRVAHLLLPGNLGIDIVSPVYFTSLSSVILDTGPGLVAPTVININGTEAGTTTTVNTDGGTNDIDVEATAGGSATTINTGASLADVAVARQRQSLDRIEGALAINGDGTTAVTVDDRATLSYFSSYVVSNLGLACQGVEFDPGTLIASAYGAQITYKDLTGLTLYTDATVNQVRVLSGVGAELTVNTGSSNSQVMLSDAKGRLDAIGNVVIHGGSGTSLILDDRASTSLIDPEPFTGDFDRQGLLEVTNYQTHPSFLVTGQKVTRTSQSTFTDDEEDRYGNILEHLQTPESYSSTSSISYDHVASLVIKGGGSDNQFKVLGTARGTPTTIDAGIGNYGIDVGDPNTNLDGIDTLIVNGNTGTTLNLDDEANDDVSEPPVAYNDGGDRHALLEVITYQTSPTYRITGQNVTRTNQVTFTDATEEYGSQNTTPLPGYPQISFVTASITFHNVASVGISGGATQNIFSVQSATAATPITINTGRDNDTVSVGSSNATVSVVNPNDGLIEGIESLAVHGNTGTMLILDDQANAPVTLKGARRFPGDYTRETSPIYQVTDHDVMRTDRVIERDPDSSTGPDLESYTIVSDTLYDTLVSYDRIADLVINGGGSSDEFNVESTASGTDTTIIPGGGHDVIDAGGSAHSLDQLLGSLTVNGGSGTTTLNLDDQSNADGIDPSFAEPTLVTNRPTYVITDGSVTRTDAQTFTTVATGEMSATNVVGMIAYSQIAALNINGGGNGNLYYIQATAPTTPLTVNAPGNDHVVISNPTLTIDDIQGPVLINGGGNVPLDVTDFHNTLGHTYTFNANSPFSSLERSGAAPITYAGTTAIQLTGGSGDDTFEFEGINTFTAVYGGSGDNTFILSPTAKNLDNLSNILVLHGTGPGPTGGTATLVVNDQANPSGATWSLAGTTLVRIRPASPDRFVTQLYSEGFISMAIHAGGGDDMLTLAGPLTSPVTFDAGGGTNALIGPSTANAWTLTGPGAGTAGSFGFSGVASLTGGAADDTFSFAKGARLAGELDGGGGTNTLDDSAYSGAVTVNLQTKSATATGGFANVQMLVGNGTSADRLIGPDAVNTWNLTGTNAGQVGAYSFSGFENLTGGTGDDSFKFGPSGAVAGRIDGGQGENWLDYASDAAPVVVNLSTNTATRVGGGITNIRDVRGGRGNDKLTGNALGNILIGGAGNDVLDGGSGRSILIGGEGKDQFKGGSGDDIVIGDSTTFDLNDAALLSILAEWQRTDEPYGSRITQIRNGGGLNGNNKLIFGTTVLNDLAADVLMGGPGSDWFFKDALDRITDRSLGEAINELGGT